MAIPLVAGAMALFNAVGKLANNFWIAWFLILALLIADTGLAVFLGFDGLVGIAITGLVNFVLGNFGINIIITSFQVMVLVAISPVVMYAVNTSGNS